MCQLDVTVQEEQLPVHQFCYGSLKMGVPKDMLPGGPFLCIFHSCCGGGCCSLWVTPRQEEGGSAHFLAYQEIWFPPGMEGGAVMGQCHQSSKGQGYTMGKVLAGIWQSLPS